MQVREYKDVDFTMLDTGDLVNLALQRSSSLAGILPPRRKHPDNWRDIYAKRVDEAREDILESIWNEIRSNYLTVRGSLAALNPNSVADIGCGQSFIDLMIYDDTQAALVLIDIEETADIYFGFDKETGSGYASLNKARDFLVSNGVSTNAIATFNPKQTLQEDLPDVDVACSFISCGFHYPVATYDTFLTNRVKNAIILDVRKGQVDQTLFQRFGKSLIIAQERKFWRILTLKNR
ncbi:MAG: hypothetical protein AAF755_03735 [Pseudomonadota bacterium]